MTSIPAFHVSTRSTAKGKGTVHINSRDDAATTGNFDIVMDVSFNPPDYPTGNIKIKANMSDSLVAGFEATSIELVNSYGKHNPTIYLTGRCKSDSPNAPKGLRYWVMVADNSSNGDGTPDIVGFVINDLNGNRVAYGTGPLKGNIVVAPN
ncbi:MAG TPA: hypothetical protein PKA39_06115 [Ignavibacteria bacterium]|nr:hypothetical protein [Ignavibacteria bacterium]